MTLLTGQPQLSMGEFMQAAGAFAAGAVATKGVAQTAVSPAMAQAKQKAHEWSEQRGASTSARLKQENAMKQDFAQTQGIDMSSSASCTVPLKIAPLPSTPSPQTSVTKLNPA